MKKAFSKVQFASKVYEPEFNESKYLERTKRNHHWLGGPEGQLKLRDLRVGVAGVGGVGSNIVEILVRSGVGHVKIADPDTIEASNINRQVIANQKTVKMKKVEASAMELRNIAEDFELVVYDEGITPENAEEFVSDLDLVVDEIDVLPFRPHVWLHQAARRRNLPLYSGYIVGLGTHVYKFHGNDYTFEDFMLNNDKEIDDPSIEFLIDRFLTPPPSYLNEEKKVMDFISTASHGAIPIFGPTTYMSHSLVAVRVISDVLGLNEQWGAPKTPVMPQYLRLDPFDLSFKILDIREKK